VASWAEAGLMLAAILLSGEQDVRPRCVGLQRRALTALLGVHSPAGDTPFLVRWSNDGRTSFFYPGPDAEIRRLAQLATPH
jgi:hypothetical protein